MKRFISFIFLASIILSGCTSEKEFTRQTAEADMLELIPPCGNSLQSFNTITETEQTESGYIFKVIQNCEPVNGEGPKMETIYRYEVTPDDIILIE